MEIGKQLFGKLSAFAVSVPISQELIQKTLSERINELEDIQVVITPDHIDLSGSVHIKKFGYHVNNASRYCYHRTVSNHARFILTF